MLVSDDSTAVFFHFPSVGIYPAKISKHVSNGRVFMLAGLSWTVIKSKYMTKFGNWCAMRDKYSSSRCVQRKG